jgi:polysaccharide biosynthesis protein PslH
MKILFVCPFPPLPADNGGAIRVWNLIQHLSVTDEIDLLCPSGAALTPEDQTALKKYCRNARLVSAGDSSRLRRATRDVGRLLRGEPFLVRYTDSPEMRQTMEVMTRETAYDVVAIEQSHTAIYLDHRAEGCRARTVLTLENVAALQYGRMFEAETRPVEKLKNLLTAIPMKWWEPRMAARFDRVITVSEADRQALLRMRPSVDSAIVPNGVDTNRCRPFPSAGRREEILFIGAMGYAPNVDAAAWLAREIFPEVRRRRPECRALVVGRAPPPAVRELQNLPGIRVEGEVLSTAPLYERVRVALAPLRSGGGTRLKILEAMAYGVPVVSTTVGCEGLDVEPGVHLLVADEAKPFAAQVVALLADPALAGRIAAAGRRLVEQRYDWSVIAGRQRAIFVEQAERKGP